MKFALTFTLLTAILAAQEPVAVKNFTLVSNAGHCMDDGVTYVASYHLPPDDPTLSPNAGQWIRPSKVTWLWGDGRRGQPASHTDADYGKTVTHHYDKPGTYSIVVIVVDGKNRNITQEMVKIRINKPWEIVE